MGDASNDFDFITDHLAIGNLASRSTPGFVAVVSVLTVVGRHRGRPWGAELTEKAPQVPSGIEVEWLFCDDDLTNIVPVLVIDIADGEASGDKTAFSCSHEDDRDLDKFLTQATSFIASEIQRGCVLVHCDAGISRSAAVVIAYLCRYTGMSYAEALAFVKAKRPQVAPADVFKKAIERWLNLTKLTTAGPRISRSTNNTKEHLMTYTITVKTTGTCLARFQTQDSHEEHGFGDIESAKNWLIKNVRFYNGVDITGDDIAIYEEVHHPVRLVKPAKAISLEQRIAELEAKLSALTASASNPSKLK